MPGLMRRRSPLGYDGSISEMYSAWVSGCAVMLTKDEPARPGSRSHTARSRGHSAALSAGSAHHADASPEIDLPYPMPLLFLPAKPFPAHS
jgi:hypothetical protein